MSPVGDRVTIVIPTYRQANQVGEAIESALAQSHAPLEVLVMDDASPDDTPSVIERWRNDPRLRAVRNPRNLGRVANYREGLGHASGDWTLMVDGDDVLLDRDFVRTAVASARAEPDTVLVVGGQRFREGERYRDYYPTLAEQERVDGWSYFLSWRSALQFMPHLGSLYRTETARAIGFYTHDILSADWESLRRLVLRGAVVLIHRLAGEWRGHDLNASKELDPRAHLDNLASILGPYEDAVRLGRGGGPLEEWRRDALRGYVAMYLDAALSVGERENIREFEQGLGHRIGVEPARELVAWCWRMRPSLWTKQLLSAVGGPALLEAGRRRWHQATWRRDR